MLCAFACSVQAAQLAVVIDDVGYHESRTKRLLDLPGPLTFAVLPFAPHARNAAMEASARGFEIILHQPMEPHPSPWARLEQGTLMSNMDDAELRHHFEAALDAVPNLAGVNNHTGSLLTAEPQAMQAVMQVVKNRGLYFLDSRTTARTVALDTARAAAIPSTKRDVFLDHVIERRSIHNAFQKALNIARRRGQAIIIAHPYELSISYLEEALRTLPEDVELVTAGSLARSAYQEAPAPRQIAAFPHKSPAP